MTLKREELDPDQKRTFETKPTFVPGGDADGADKLEK
jgi:hypothetical protein